MKALLRIFRPSRKLVLVIGGIALLAGGSGAAALYVGKDKILGPSAEETNGLECTDVNLVTIRKLNRFWIRKYIKTQPTDGMTRIKTALRVAKAVYDAQKPDLVQVVVLDENGPSLRSDIRGRAIGADVIYIPNPAKVPEEPNSPLFSAKYYDGSANDGMFFGEKIELPLPDIEKLNASFKAYDDCADPLVADAAAAEEGGKKKGKSEKKPAEEGGEASAPAAEGSAPSEAAPAAEHGSPAGGESSSAAPAEEAPPPPAAPPADHSAG